MMTVTGCGCGCGGLATHVGSAFVRPRFFAGMLLTEDDLQTLTGYITGKDRLRNRLLSGTGVVCGLEVVCDPCGNGKVTVRPGYALDRCGNDIVVGCPEQVDITALVHDLRVRSLGVDCGDPCDNHEGDREYGLYVRYTEEPIEPIAPYATDESCPPIGCEPSRVRETYRFLVKCDVTRDDRYRPADRLKRRLGDSLDDVRSRGHWVGQYRQPLLGAVQAAGTSILFDDETGTRFQAALADLTAVLAEIGEGTPSAEQARAATEHVRALASTVARYDLYDAAGQEDLGNRYDFTAARSTLDSALSKLDDTVTGAVWPDARRRSVAKDVLDETRALVVNRGAADAPLETRLLAQGAPLGYGQEDLGNRYDFTAARSTLDSALSKLDDTVTGAVWPDARRRSVAKDVLDETRALVVNRGTADAPLETRLLAQGAPLGYGQRAALFGDLSRVRQWLLARLDQDRELADCEIRGIARTATLPPALPPTPPPGRERATATELDLAAGAAGELGSALPRYVADVACASILPPCGEPADGDVLLAHLELRDCDVIRICAAEREQWLPGGPGYAAWLSKLDRARELAARVCCQPPPTPGTVDTGTADEQGPVPLPYVAGLILGEPARTDLDELLDLLRSTAEPAARVEVAGITAAGESASTEGLRRELTELRDLVETLRAPASSPPPAPLPSPSPSPSPEPSPSREPEPADQVEEQPPEEPARKAPPQKATPRKSARTPRGQRPGSQGR